MGLFTPIRPILRSRNFGENGSLGWPTHSPYRSTPPHTEDIVPICVNLTDRNWKDCVTGPTGCEPKLRERAPQETFHLVESMASFSLKLGCSLGTGCGELGWSFFGVGVMSAFIESAIRFDFASALSTLTFTIGPGLTASEGSLMKRFESSLMCTNAMT